MLHLTLCALTFSCEDAKQKIAMETRTAKKAVEECHQQQSEHVLKQGELEGELADLKSEGL